MTKRKDKRRDSTHLARIERKCDRVLSELIIIRQQLNAKPDIDSAIDKMHRSARRMRIMAERERDYARRMFHSFTHR